jgi:hypothetical protein
MDGRIRPDRSAEVGRPAIDEDIDVGSQARTVLDEPVAHPRRRGIERGDQRVDVVTGQLVPALGARKERQQRSRQQHRRHGQSRTTASTAQISGRLPVTIRQDSPSSELCQSWPVLVPNVTPTGSSESRAIASRRTLR